MASDVETLVSSETTSKGTKDSLGTSSGVTIKVQNCMELKVVHSAWPCGARR